jgi:hypothetical protein
LYHATLPKIERPLKPLKSIGLSTINGEHFVQLLKIPPRPRSLGDYEGGSPQDRSGRMERVAGVAKQIPADHMPGILKLQDLLDNDGKCRRLQQSQEMTIFDWKPPWAT